MFRDLDGYIRAQLDGSRIHDLRRQATDGTSVNHFILYVE